MFPHPKPKDLAKCQGVLNAGGQETKAVEGRLFIDGWGPEMTMNGSITAYVQVILMIGLIIAVIMVGDNLQSAIGKLDNDLRSMDGDIVEVEHVCSKQRAASE